ncbi:MAG: heavy metal translocating P-type ATPase [Aquabacterium sp.]|nr:heavy metal translocating P-type ATPase [Aquabacterium sp.]
MGQTVTQIPMSSHHEHHSHDDHAHGDEPCSATSPAAMPPVASCETTCCSHDVKPVPVALGEPVAMGASTQTPIRIMQMDCPTEEALLRKRLGGMAGVLGMEFNLMQRVLTVSHEPQAIEPILDAVRSLGFTPEIATGTSSDAALAPEPAKPWWPLALAGAAAIAAEAVHWLGLPTWLAAVLAVTAVLACGITTYKKGWVAIRNGNLNINALMSIAVTGALVLGQWPEAAMVMVLFTVAELIEAKSLDRARNAIQGLMQLTPERATVLQADGSWQEIAAKSVAVGARVRVKPGERIALDGTIASGRSTVNQAPITGESLPVDKAQGDAVFAGTINESGSFEYVVTAAAGDSTLARIIHAVEEAQGAKAPTQRFVDQFARVYTPVVFAIALAVAILPPLLMGGVWFDWVYKALVLLVIACPCALVISTPVTIVSGLAAAARQGILIKGGAYLEEGRKLAWLALDKTGTITHGKPVQTDFVVLNGHSEADVRSLAASLASRSDHPVSRALAAADQQDGIALHNVDAFEALPGRGSKGLIGGKAYLLGNHRLIHEQGRCSEALEARLTALEEQGKTVILLTDEESVQGLFAVADTVKDSSRQAIAELHELGIKTVMLTGDNAHTARAIAAQVGIDEAQGDMLPEDKLRAIEGKIKQGGAVGMVGDGINDAPALARADIGFAMGAAGTGTAIETADVALMDDDLRKLPRFVRLSRRTHALLVQNIVLALGIKAVFLVLTLTGLGTMWMAVFADVGASLLVVGNGLRLLRVNSSR